jgi:hypothetical protein
VCGITGLVDFEQDLTGQRAQPQAPLFSIVDRERLAAAFATDPELPGRIAIQPGPMVSAAFLMDVNEWLTEYRVSLV